jgi:hypothetical protein
MRRVWIPLLALFFSAGLYAKRSLPPEVEPIVHRGIRYSIVIERNSRYFLAYLLSEQVPDTKVLAKTELYRIPYDTSLERDVQEIFPESMKIRGRDIVITDENGRAYRATLQER